MFCKDKCARGFAGECVQYICAYPRKLYTYTISYAMPLSSLNLPCLNGGMASRDKRPQSPSRGLASKNTKKKKEKEKEKT